MTHGQRAYAHDASDLTVETAIMANYNSGNLPKGVASGLADTVKAVNESQPDTSEMTVTLWGEVTATIIRGSSHLKATKMPTPWKAIACASLARHLPNVRQVVVREGCAANAAQYEPIFGPAEQAIVDAVHASKPKVLQPGQRTVRWGAVEINIASTLPAMIAE
jgi:hypothetical protein